MEAAVKPVNGTNSLNFYLEGIDSSQKFYLYFHFVEVEEVQAGQFRQFTISLNDRTIFGPIGPKYMAPVDEHSAPQACDQKLNSNKMHIYLYMFCSGMIDMITC